MPLAAVQLSRCHGGSGAQLRRRALSCLSRADGGCFVPVAQVVWRAQLAVSIACDCGWANKCDTSAGALLPKRLAPASAFNLPRALLLHPAYACATLACCYIPCMHARLLACVHSPYDLCLRERLATPMAVLPPPRRSKRTEGKERPCYVFEAERGGGGPRQLHDGPLVKGGTRSCCWGGREPLNSSVAAGGRTAHSSERLLPLHRRFNARAVSSCKECVALHRQPARRPEVPGLAWPGTAGPSRLSCAFRTCVRRTRC
jgi:hypothetical protein